MTVDFQLNIISPKGALFFPDDEGRPSGQKGQISGRGPSYTTSLISMLQWLLFVFSMAQIGDSTVYTVSVIGHLFRDSEMLTYFIATRPDRGWQRNEGLLLLHSFLAFSTLWFGTSAKSVS